MGTQKIFRCFPKLHFAVIPQMFQVRRNGIGTLFDDIFHYFIFIIRLRFTLHRADRSQRTLPHACAQTVAE